MNQQQQRQAKRVYWRAVLGEWARSGLSKRTFACQQGLDYQRLRWWASQHPEWSRLTPVGEDDSAPNAATPAAAPTFVTIAPEASPAGEAPGEASGEPVRLRVQGVTVEVPPGFCEPTLERLLGVLERRS